MAHLRGPPCRAARHALAAPAATATTTAEACCDSAEQLGSCSTAQAHDTYSLVEIRLWTGRLYNFTGRSASYAPLSLSLSLSQKKVGFLPHRVSFFEGRHQIRVHMATEGHPIVSDATYGGGRASWCRRFFLHCFSLGFDHGPLSASQPLSLAELRPSLSRYFSSNFGSVGQVARVVETPASSACALDRPLPSETRIGARRRRRRARHDLLRTPERPASRTVRRPASREALGSPRLQREASLSLSAVFPLSRIF